ncbi:MAG: hypothetical protein R8M14_04955 [Ghiorsea sp.]
MKVLNNFISSVFICFVSLSFCNAWISNVQAQEFTALPKLDQARIADLIFRNECNRKVECLVSWNDGEEFASLGIGHFIWFPQGSKAPFQESFPDLLGWLHNHNVKIPNQLVEMLKLDMPAPWQTRQDFLSPENQKDIEALRLFLVNTQDEQAAFMMNRLAKALPKMLEVGRNPSEGNHIKQQFERVSASANGWYVLADYVNFKGEGINDSERYQGQGWGLSQVLLHMKADAVDAQAIESFIQSASFVLERRIKLSPPERNENRWLTGWLKRLATYRK